jgi:hypothetical protein
MRAGGAQIQQPEIPVPLGIIARPGTAVNNRVPLEHTSPMIMQPVRMLVTHAEMDILARMRQPGICAPLGIIVQVEVKLHVRPVIFALMGLPIRMVIQ